MKCVFFTYWWIYAVALATLVSPLPSGADRIVHFECRAVEGSNCSCATSGEDHFEVSCPRDASTPDIEFNIRPKYVHLQCSMNAKRSDYSMLPRIPSFDTYEGMTSFNFLGCPLPEVPLSEIITKLGITKRLQGVFFQSHQRNLSNTLKKYHLQGLGGVPRLVLSGNALTDIPDDLLADMQNLTWLNLRGNKLHLNANLLKYVPQLLLLELGTNELKSLPEGLFEHSNNLTQLNLWQNKFTNLTSDDFKGLNSLSILDLSGNLFEGFHPDIFKHVPNLQILDISLNNFTSLPGNLFAHNKNLRELKLAYNRRTLSILPSKFLSNQKYLKQVYLKSNKIESLADDTFWDSTEILQIHLSDNNISEISNELFKDQIKLEELYLDNNRISYLAEGAFQSLFKLKILNLNYNHITKISGKLFSGLSSLHTLHMKNNDLNTVSHTAFASTLKLTDIDMSYNNLSFMTNDNTAVDDPFKYGYHSPFSNIIKNIENINLSHNALTEVFYDWKILGLKANLDLSYNEINKITFNDIYFLGKNIVVDLRYNNISEISFMDAYVIAYAQNRTEPSANVPKILVENNPINCDCDLFDFLKYLKGAGPKVANLIKVVPEKLPCASPPNLKGRLVTELNTNELVCSLDGAGTKKPLCPSQCSCTVRISDKAVIVDCSAKNMNSYLFLPNVTALHLNHIELNLENNMMNNISSLGLTDNRLNQVTKMYLAGNNISQIAPNEIPDSLEILDLRNNRLEYFNTPEVLDKLSQSLTLKEMYFSGNPIKCDCENYLFLAFLQEKYKQVKDMNKLKCEDAKQIDKYDLSKLCDVSPAVIASSVVIAIAGLILGIIGALYYKYQQEIKVWLFAKQFCLCCVTEEEVDKDKLYDAFVSFSHKDEDFVINKLVPELEGGPNPFKICLHFRDWMAGEWIPTQIARSVQDSRRTIVVLSPNFLESVWSRMEFRAAHNRALSEGRTRVIVILYGDIGSTDNLDPELQAYLSMNTYVKWGDPWFWNKLRYALPHPPYNKHHLPTPGVLSKKGFDDRLELIHPTTPSTPPGQNTPPAHQAHTNPLMNHVNSMPNGIKSPSILNGTITMNGLKINGNAKHSDV